MRSWINHFRSIFDTEASGRLIIYALLVGIVAGLGAAAFYWLLDLLQAFALGSIEGYYPPPAGDEVAHHAMQLPTRWWVVLIVPTWGGLLCGLILATDIAAQPVLTVTPRDDLHKALRVFTQKNIDEVPVVDAEDKHHILGMLNRRDVIAAYHERITRLRSPDQ